MSLTRRAFLGAAAALGSAAAFGRDAPAAPGPLPPAPKPVAERVVEHTLVAAERPGALPCLPGHTLPLWTFGEKPEASLIRLRFGERLVTKVSNRLSRPGEHISIHWHGIRLPNDQDGVPYLTQKPIEPGEDYSYSFVPPDAGTFFFHTHCNTAEQLGRGLAGILIVDGDETEPYDADQIIALRDWRIGEDGTFLPFLTQEGAGKAGTFGTIRSANGAANPQIPLPASADVRLRILNIDPTRIIEIGIEGAEATVVAIDGLACPPFPLRSWRMGPAMRADLVVRTPRDGGEARLVDYFSAAPVPLARLVSRGPDRRTGLFDPAPLHRPAIAEPKVEGAERMPFVFSATATGSAVAAAADDPNGPLLGSLCLSAGSFWAINKQAWPANGHEHAPPPIAMLERGRTYRFELRNTTPHMHPIHIHGHSFTVLGSNKRALPPHKADTVLLLPKERLDVAFVADNPGDWMFHCHIIEHQETGMMAYLRVA